MHHLFASQTSQHHKTPTHRPIIFHDNTLLGFNYYLSVFYITSASQYYNSAALGDLQVDSMVVERKRSPPRSAYAVPNNTFATTSSAFSRHAAATRSPAKYPGGRTDSPPASAYFSDFVGEQDPQPITPETSSHFAYSTTLRRHSLSHPAGVTSFEELRSVVAEEGPSGLWHRVVAPIKGYFSQGGGQTAEYERVPMQVLKEEKHETPSSRFVYYNVQVSQGLRLWCVIRWCPGT